GLVELSGHFHADHTAFRLESDGVEDVSSKKSEIAIDIAKRQVECPAHHTTVHRADKDAIPRIRPLHLIAVDEIDARGQLGEQIVNFADIILSIAVGIENEVLAGIGEARNQSRSVPKISRVMNDAQKRHLGSKPVENRAGLIFTAVVDDQDFKVVGHFLHFDN